MLGTFGCKDPESGCVCLSTTVVQSLDEGHYPCKDLNTLFHLQRDFHLIHHIFLLLVQLPETSKDRHKTTTSLFLSQHTLTKPYSQSLPLLSQCTAQEPPMVPSALRI